jgi:hypothetical protein
MISSLPIFVITATELAARAVANRPAVPIDGRNTDSQARQQLNLTCFSRAVPDPRGLARQNSALQQLHGCRQNSLASTPWQLSP